MVNYEVKWTTIRVSRQTKDALDSVKHPGQSYDGVIQELVKFRTRRQKQRVTAHSSVPGEGA